MSERWTAHTPRRRPALAAACLVVLAAWQASAAEDEAELSARCDVGELASCKALADALAARADVVRAIRLYTQACDGGERGACTNLGVIAQRGSAEMPVDLPRARGLYARACEAGDATGCSNLGTMYADGTGVPLDLDRAAALYRRACDANDAVGCANLGRCYETGRGAPRDGARAAALYERACEIDDFVPAACNGLGRILEAGQGVPQDALRAARLYLRASQSGDPLARYNLARLYDLAGGPLRQNHERAFELYSTACDENVGEACLAMGERYARGDIPPTDMMRAQAMFALACSLDVQRGCERVAIPPSPIRATAAP
jgi:hypothetical protein